MPRITIHIISIADKNDSVEVAAHVTTSAGYSGTLLVNVSPQLVNGPDQAFAQGIADSVVSQLTQLTQVPFTPLDQARIYGVGVGQGTVIVNPVVVVPPNQTKPE